jgi:hypothetical protein
MNSVNVTLSNTVLIMNYVYQADVLLMYSVLAFLCIVIMALSFHYRNQQPVKSRYILPYFGPAGLLFMCVDKIITACVLIYDPTALLSNIQNPTTTFEIIFYTDLVTSHFLVTTFTTRIYAVFIPIDTLFSDEEHVRNNHQTKYQIQQNKDRKGS